MIELLLEAGRAHAAGRLDQADRLYAQAADRDPQNAIAVAGLARVAAARGDASASLVLARRALAIDPENAVARRLAEAAGSAGTPGSADDTGSAGAVGPGLQRPPDASTDPMGGDDDGEATESSADGAATEAPADDRPAPPGAADAPPRRGLLDRLLRRG